MMSVVFKTVLTGNVFTLAFDKYNDLQSNLKPPCRLILLCLCIVHPTWCYSLQKPRRGICEHSINLIHT